MMPDGTEAATSGTSRDDHRISRRSLVRAGGGILLAGAAGNVLGNGSAFAHGVAMAGSVTPQMIGTETVDRKSVV